MIRTARKALGISQGEAGRRVGIGQDEWSRIETRQRTPPPELGAAIATELGVSADALMLWCSRGRIPPRFEALVDEHAGEVIAALEALLAAVWVDAPLEQEEAAE